ncbi:hypothetical protein AURDEDRAFT_116832 [Auricularia subglabra TFB-10046 SS5]|nr:hypothetical protein AURDEDRAFT_116832 [Auricularia subglabra TFB-10046 SS5]
MVAYSKPVTVEFPPPRAQKDGETVADYCFYVDRHLRAHVVMQPAFAVVTNLMGLLARDKDNAAAHLAKLKPVADYIVGLCPREGFDRLFVLTVALEESGRVWKTALRNRLELQAQKEADKEHKKRENANNALGVSLGSAAAPAPAHSVSGHTPARHTHARAAPYDLARRGCKAKPKKAAPADGIDALTAAMQATTLEAAVELKTALDAAALPGDEVDVLCASFANASLKPATRPVPRLAPVFHVAAPLPVEAVVPAPAPAPVPAPSPTPRLATIALPDVGPATVPAPVAVEEPVIQIKQKVAPRTKRAPYQPPAPYSKAARPAHKRAVKLAAPAPIVQPAADVPYIEAVTETLSGEHLCTEVHILDARPLRDGRLVRREARSWRRIAVA